MRKSSGISAADGIGRRNSIGTRNARAAKSLEPSTIPSGTASTVASASPSAQPRTVWANAVQKRLVCIIDQSSLKVVLIDGRSRSEIRPVRETSSQNTSAAAIESDEDERLDRARGSRRSRVGREWPGCARLHLTQCAAP